MVTKPFGVIIACSGFLFIIQTVLPKAMAMRKSPSVDEFMIEDQRTHKRKNYVVQRALDNEMLNNIDNIGPAYETESFEPDTSPEELPALIVDYANMIRNDIILLDNSVETRTRKRGNIKKFNQAIPDPPCSCESVKEVINLGANTYPQFVESRNCSKGTCPPPYSCMESYYYITVLRLKSKVTETSPEELPYELNRWIASKVNVTTACVCARDTIQHN